MIEEKIPSERAAEPLYLPRQHCVCFVLSCARRRDTQWSGNQSSTQTPTCAGHGVYFLESRICRSKLLLHTNNVQWRSRPGGVDPFLHRLRATAKRRSPWQGSTSPADSNWTPRLVRPSTNGGCSALASLIGGRQRGNPWRRGAAVMVKHDPCPGWANSSKL